MNRSISPRAGLQSASSQVPSRAVDFEEQVSRLYAASAFSRNLFASPLGPVAVSGRERFLPRFVNITPLCHPESLRVAVHAGHSHKDYKSTAAVLHMAHLFLAKPDIADGLTISLLPLLDLAGLHAAREEADLLRQDWRNSDLPEVQAAARDLRQRSYHLVVELVTEAPGDGDDLLTVSLSGLAGHDFGPYADEVLSSSDFAPFDVRFALDHSPASHGPLTICEDLPFAPVILRLSPPANWPIELYSEAFVRIARTLIHRYRSHQSFGQHI
jgi:hypothetical protein